MVGDAKFTHRSHIMPSTFGLYSFLANVTQCFQNSGKLACILMVMTTLSLIGIWAYAASGVDDSDNTGKAAEIITFSFKLWTTFLVLWVIISMTPTLMQADEYLCCQGHCPESLYLYNNSWLIPAPDPEGYIGIFFTIFEQNWITRKKQSNISMNTIPMLLDSKNLTSVHWNGINRDNPITTLKKYKPTSINVNVIIVICNVAFYFVIFAYGWIILYSYLKELQSKLCIAEKKPKYVKPECKETPDTPPEIDC